MKKFLCIILCFLLVSPSFFTLNVSAEGEDTIVLSDLDSAEENNSFLLDEFKTLDDVTIYVSGEFEKQGFLSVEKVESYQKSENNVAQSFSYDIKVLDEEGNELQPIDTVNISFEFNSIDENLTAEVYHEEDFK